MKTKHLSLLALALAGCLSVGAKQYKDDCYEIAIGEVNIDCETGQAHIGIFSVKRRESAPANCPAIGERCIRIFHDEPGPNGEAPNGKWDDADPGDPSATPPIAPRAAENKEEYKGSTPTTELSVTDIQLDLGGETPNGGATRVEIIILDENGDSIYTKNFKAS